MSNHTDTLSVARATKVTTSYRRLYSSDQRAANSGEGRIVSCQKGRHPQTVSRYNMYIRSIGPSIWVQQVVALAEKNKQVKCNIFKSLPAWNCIIIFHMLCSLPSTSVHALASDRSALCKKMIIYFFDTNLQTCYVIFDTNLLCDKRFLHLLSFPFFVAILQSMDYGFAFLRWQMGNVCLGCKGKFLSFPIKL